MQIDINERVNKLLAQLREVQEREAMLRGAISALRELQQEAKTPESGSEADAEEE